VLKPLVRHEQSWYRERQESMLPYMYPLLLYAKVQASDFGYAAVTLTIISREESLTADCSWKSHVVVPPSRMCCYHQTTTLKTT